MDRDKMRSESHPRFVSFEHRGEEYIAFIALEDAFADPDARAPELRKTSEDSRSRRSTRSFSKTTSAAKLTKNPETCHSTGRRSNLFPTQHGGEDDLDDLLSGAARVYGAYVHEIRSLITRADQMKKDLVPVPALLGWQLGDAVFRLKDALEQMLFEVDDLYSHLERDTGVARALLKDAVSFRRYLPDSTHIPSDLTWNQCRRAPRRAALQIKRAAIVGTCGDLAEKSDGQKERG